MGLKSETTRPWNPNDLSTRLAGSWMYFRDGVIVPITEDEARHNFDRWRIRSDERGGATFMLDQLWNEIDLLRAEAERLGDDLFEASSEAGGLRAQLEDRE